VARLFGLGGILLGPFLGRLVVSGAVGGVLLGHVLLERRGNVWLS